MFLNLLTDHVIQHGDNACSQHSSSICLEQLRQHLESTTWKEVMLGVGEVAKKTGHCEQKLTANIQVHAFVFTLLLCRTSAGGSTFFRTRSGSAVASLLNNVCRAPFSTALTWTAGLLQDTNSLDGTGPEDPTQILSNLNWNGKYCNVLTSRCQLCIRWVSVFPNIVQMHLAIADPSTKADVSCNLMSVLFKPARMNWSPPIEHRVWALST